MTPEFLEAVLDGRRDEAADLAQVELPDGFPDEGVRGFFAKKLVQMREDPRCREWCPHLVVLDGRMIGHAGYHGPPGVNALNDPEAVEIGYTIEPEYRGQGHATSAASELLRNAEQRGVRHFVASTAPDNEPSLAIIRRLGFTQRGEVMRDEDGLELVFGLER
jgi:ribosomal-protein-alanine N-acetyltransferase